MDPLRSSVTNGTRGLRLGVGSSTGVSGHCKRPEISHDITHDPVYAQQQREAYARNGSGTHGEGGT